MQQRTRQSDWRTGTFKTACSSSLKVADSQPGGCFILARQRLHFRQPASLSQPASGFNFASQRNQNRPSLGRWLTCSLRCESAGWRICCRPGRVNQYIQTKLINSFFLSFLFQQFFTIFIHLQQALTYLIIDIFPYV